MTWLNKHDSYSSQLHVARLSDAAYRLNDVGMEYCARLGTDGFVDARDVPGLVRNFKKRTLDELTSGQDPVWKTITIAGVIAGYDIPDFLGINKNRTSDQVAAARESQNERTRKSRAKKSRPDNVTNIDTRSVTTR